MALAGLLYEAGGIDAMRSQTRFLGALCLSGALMVGKVLVVVARALPSWPGLFAGVGAGAGVFILALRMTRSLEASWDRLQRWTGLLPTPIGRITLHLFAPRRKSYSTPGRAA